jgi:hypothetical protein
MGKRQIWLDNMALSISHSRITGIRPDIGLAVILWVLLSAAAGFRWLGLGRDYGEYIIFYNQLGSFETIRHSRFEIGFVLISWLFKQLGAPYAMVASTLVGFSLSIKFHLIFKYTRWPITAIICYICLFYFLHEYTQIRAGVAISFGLSASYLYCQKKYLKSMMFLIIGALFQSSVLAFIAGFVIYSCSKNIRYLVFCVIFILLLIISFRNFPIIEWISVLNPLIVSYINEASDFDPPNKFSPINVFMFMSIITSFFYASKDSIVGQRMSLIMTILALVTFFAFYDIPLIANRMFGLYAVFLIFLSFNFRYFNISALAGFFTVLSAVWAVRNAFGQGLIG